MFVLIFRDGFPDSVMVVSDMREVEWEFHVDPSMIGYYAVMPDGTPSLEHTPHVIGEPLCGSFDLN